MREIAPYIATFTLAAWAHHFRKRGQVVQATMSLRIRASESEVIGPLMYPGTPVHPRGRKPHI